MRLLPVFLFTGCVSAIALACGGANDQDVLSQSSTSSSGSTTASSSGSTTASSSGTTTSGSSGSTTSGSSGATTSGSSSGGKNPGACEQEQELNNEPGQANELKDSTCGTILTTTDLDYLTFKLPGDAKTMSLTYEGDVKLRISVEGQNPVELSPSSNPPVPFAPGKDYIIRITAASQAAVKVDWRVNLSHT